MVVPLGENNGQLVVAMLDVGKCAGGGLSFDVNR